MAATAGCGPDACAVAGGGFEIALPEGGGTGTGGMPAVVFLHGAGSSGDGMMTVAGMVQPILARGYAFIAAEGLPRPGPTAPAGRYIPEPPPEDEVRASRHGVAEAR